MRRAHPHALLVIAPRKPERFGEAEALARAEGLRVVRRTELAVDAEPRADVVILDTIGELAHLFQVATVVFVGGSLVDQGGHNILEPAVHGKPIVFGPHMENFAEIAATFLQQSGGGPGARSPAELVGDGRPADRRSGRARAARRRGARARRSEPRRQAAHARRHRRASAAARARRGVSVDGPFHRWARPMLTSAVPVDVSVGNLAMGGRGKTPVVAHLARTAGRRRRAAGDSQPRLRPTAPWRTASSSSATACTSLRGSRSRRRRAADAGARRCRARRCSSASSVRSPAFAERVLGATVLVLDDGFQHRVGCARRRHRPRVAPPDLRDRRVPFGRLREPVSALARAHAVIVDGRRVRRGRAIA